MTVPYTELLAYPHLLIGGTTGSGKSVFIRSLLHELIKRSPNDVNIVLLDPKEIDLAIYDHLPHVIAYADEIGRMSEVLDDCIAEMKRRYTKMKQERIFECSDPDLYIIIDEFADLMLTDKRGISEKIQKLAQLARGANIHLILATQRPTRDIVCGGIAANMTVKIALRCASAQEARNMAAPSAHLLPKNGQCYMISPDYSEPQKFTVPFLSLSEAMERVKEWEDVQNVKQESSATANNKPDTDFIKQEAKTDTVYINTSVCRKSSYIKEKWHCALYRAKTAFCKVLFILFAVAAIVYLFCAFSGVVNADYRLAIDAGIVGTALMVLSASVKRTLKSIIKS